MSHRLTQPEEIDHILMTEACALETALPGVFSLSGQPYLSEAGAEHLHALRPTGPANGSWRSVTLQLAE